MAPKKKRPPPIPGGSKFARVLASATRSALVSPSVPAEAPFSSSLLLADPGSIVVSVGAPLASIPVEMKEELSLSPEIGSGSLASSTAPLSVSSGSVAPPLVLAAVSLSQSPSLVECTVEEGEIVENSLQTSALASGSGSGSVGVSETFSTIPIATHPSNPSDKAAIAAVADPNYSSTDPSVETESQIPHVTLPWASKFKASLRNLKKMDSPTFLDDGTPVVVAPSSVLLKAAAMWKGHVVAQFHGLCPTPNRIFSDLNPIWGNFGDITVRIVSDTVALIFIPAVNTRQWVTDVGFWQAGNCSCTVYPWSPDGLRDLKDLKSAPTWAILKNVPPQLYSLEGISVIASGIGEPLHTEKSWLDPINIGSTKVKVVIDLDTPLPSAIVVRDVKGNSVRVDVDYPRPPPKCLNCGKYGHLLSRCPIPLLKKAPFKKDIPAGSKELVHTSASFAAANELKSEVSSVAKDAGPKPKRRRSRSRSGKRATSAPPSSVWKQPSVIPRSQLSSSKGRDKKKWVAKSAGPPNSTLLPSYIPPVAAEGVLLKDKPPEKSRRDSIMDPDPNFPLPPGWTAMSTKSKKKELKKWHNRLRSAGIGAQGIVRGETSGEPLTR